MAEEILLDYVINRPNIPLDRQETELKVLLKINASNALRAGGEQVVLPIHLAMVLDVSSSMKTREIDALKRAAQAAVDQLRPGDFVTVLAFQSVVYDIVSPTRIEDSSTAAMIKSKIEVIDQFQGGGTDMEYAITKAEHHLNMVPGQNLVRRIMLFTDGQLTGMPDKCLQRAAEISASDIGIDALGFGPEFDYKFMQRLASFSSGSTAKIDSPEEIEQVFSQRVQEVASSIAKNVRLDLTFTPQVRAGRGYRYSPEIAYMGKMKLPGDVRTISIPLGTLERDKEYAFLVSCTTPTRPEGHIRVIKAELFYDVPAMGVEGGSSLQSVIVNYTGDPQLVAQVNGEVERAFDEVEIGRKIEALDRAMAQQNGQEAAILFDKLTEAYRELGDEEMATHYVELKSKYAAQGMISQDDMNYTRHKSTQKRSGGVQLVDASSLI